MAEPGGTSRALRMQLLYLALSLVFAFVALLPFETAAGRVAGPDLILALTFAWALRRPAWLPLPLVAVTMLLGDLLFQRPPGLHAALAVLATEWLKQRGRHLRDRSLAAELLSTTLALAAVMLAERLLMAMVVLPLPGWPLTFSAFATTALSVPVVLVLSRLLLGMRRLAPGEAEDRRPGR